MKHHTHSLVITSIASLVLTPLSATATPSRCAAASQGIIGIMVSSLSNPDPNNPTSTLNIGRIDTQTVTYQFTNNTTTPFAVGPLTALLSRPTSIQSMTTSSTCGEQLQKGDVCTQTVTLTTTNAPISSPYSILSIQQVCDISGKYCSRTGSCNQVTINVTQSTTPPMTTLSSTPASGNLALKKSGNNRIITIQNTGAAPTDALTVQVSPSFPTGTSIISDGCTGQILQSLEKCFITIHPGANSTSNCATGIAPTASIVTVNADNVTTPATMAVDVLDYGCIYQDGYLFSINDTTTQDVSIGGSVLAQQDQQIPTQLQFWAANSDTSAIQGIDETSIYPPCNGKSDGACDTQQIASYYPGTPLVAYAAGNCLSGVTSSIYTDWYLPAICQMDMASGFCTGIDSVAQNLGLLIGGTCSAGAACLSTSTAYWTSTQYSSNENNAWTELFTPDSPNNDIKTNAYNVRCARDLVQ